MTSNLENIKNLEEISRDRMFIHALMEDLVSAYHSYCFLNTKDTQKLAENLGIEVTINKILKKNIVVSWIIALCKIYEKPSDKNPSNVNIHKFLNEIKQQSLSLSEQTKIDHVALLKKINEIEHEISKFRELIDIAFLWRNKSLAHIDSKLLLPNFKNTDNPNFDLEKEFKKYYKQLDEKRENLMNSLFKITEFTIKELDYLIELTEDIGMEVQLSKAYQSLDMKESKKEIITLYGLK